MAGKRGIEAGKAYVKAYLDDSLLRRGLRGMRNTFSRFASGLGTILTAGIGAGAIGAALGMRKVMTAISDTATVKKTADAFGLAAEEASALFGVFKASGATNARENIESLVTMSGRITDAVAGRGEQAKRLFEGLNITAQQLSKLPLDEQFFRLHEAIMKLPNPIDRVNRLMLAFGEDGGKTLIGTLSKSTEELRKIAAQFRVTNADAEQATKTELALAAASNAMSRTFQKIAFAIAPIMEDMANSVTASLQKMNEKFPQTANIWERVVKRVALANISLETSFLDMEARLLELRGKNEVFAGFWDMVAGNGPVAGNMNPTNRDDFDKWREQQRRELLNRADSLRKLRDVRLDEFNIIDQGRGQKMGATEIMRGELIRKTQEVAKETARRVSGMTSLGTFSGRAASLLSAKADPTVELNKKQLDVQQRIERNTREFGIAFE